MKKRAKGTAVFGSTKFQQKSQSPLGGITDRIQLLKYLKRKLRAKNQKKLRSPEKQVNFQTWVERFHVPNAHERAQISDALSCLKVTPAFSIFVSTKGASAKDLEKSFTSVHKQLYLNWELVFLSAEDDPHKELLQSFSARLNGDFRLRILEHESHLSEMEACNYGAKQSFGDWISLLKPGSTLSCHALFLLANAIQSNPDAAILYTDEDFNDQSGNRTDPQFKPSWSPDLYYAKDYIGNAIWIERNIWEGHGGLKEEHGKFSRYELCLRATAYIRRERIVRVPYIILHSPKNECSPEQTLLEAEQRRLILQNFLLKKHKEVSVKILNKEGDLEVNWPLPKESPLVSVVIATAAKDPASLSQCINGLLHNTDYPNLELVFVLNNLFVTSVRSYLRKLALSDDRIKILEFEGLFNYSKIHNFAIPQTKGKYIIMLNDDVEITQKDWVNRLVGFCVRSEIGIAGVKLLYPDRTLQHAGVTVGLWGAADHPFKRLPESFSGPNQKLDLHHNLSAVTAACMMFRREVFDEVLGFEEKLSVAFNDVDFCLRVHDAGYFNVLVPSVTLVHHESLSRGYDKVNPTKRRRHLDEIQFLRTKWSQYIGDDPYYNPNLNLSSLDATLSEHPRLKQAWSWQNDAPSFTEFVIKVEQLPTGETKLLSGWVATNQEILDIVLESNNAKTEELVDRWDVMIHYKGLYSNCIGFRILVEDASIDIEKIKVIFKESSDPSEVNAN